MEVASFAEIADEFTKRVSRIVWCTASTVDRKGRPRSRILHPIWEGTTGYIATGRHTLKEKHLAANPFVSLSYWDPQHEQVYIDCRSEWEDSPAEKRRIWELYRAAPPPLGFDPSLIWLGGPDDPSVGIMKLTPWRIELSSLRAPIEPKLIWHA